MTVCWGMALVGMPRNSRPIIWQMAKYRARRVLPRPPMPMRDVHSPFSMNPSPRRQLDGSGVWAMNWDGRHRSKGRAWVDCAGRNAIRARSISSSGSAPSDTPLMRFLAAWSAARRRSRLDRVAMSCGAARVVVASAPSSDRRMISCWVRRPWERQPWQQKQ